MDRKTKITSLIPDAKNANKHSEIGTGLLQNSLRENGAGRSILISNDNVVIAGNGTLEGFAAVGMDKVRIIETDGKELIAVKRTDIKSGTASFHRMALADNIVAQKNIVMDVEVVEGLVVEHAELKAWAGYVIDPPGGGKTDPDSFDGVKHQFNMTGAQSAKLKTALKLSKDLNKAKFANTGNDNDNANALHFIVAEYLKAHKK